LLPFAPPLKVGGMQNTFFRGNSVSGSLLIKTEPAPHLIIFLTAAQISIKAQ
jgi:hypothetical protein